MATNRMLGYRTPASRAPRPVKNPAASIPPGFVVCPPQWAVANSWQQQIYRLAYERAKAEAEIPRHHRLLFAVWN